MILAAQHIRERNILNPFSYKTYVDKISYGLGPASYDVRLDQDITLGPFGFSLASTIEYFSMPNDIAATVHDKSTWARLGIAVQTTFIDPGWNGYLTLEISNNTDKTVELKRGYGIAQIIFHQMSAVTEIPYSGKYQNQKKGPQEGIV